MKEDILAILLQAEEEYGGTVKNAVDEAEDYVEGRRKEQAEYIEQLKQELFLFEAAENEKLELSLTSEREKMEREAARLKNHMKDRQQEKADRIGELLKEEVLSLLWR